MVLCRGKNPVYKTMVLYCTIFLELGIRVPNIVLIDKIAVCTHNFINIKLNITILDKYTYKEKSFNIADNFNCTTRFKFD